jgi:hypothetical protein
MRENLHAELSATDNSQTGDGVWNGRPKDTFGCNIWRSNTVADRRSNMGFRSEAGADWRPAGSRKCQRKLGNQPEHPLAYHGSGKILEEARGNRVYNKTPG